MAGPFQDVLKVYKQSGGSRFGTLTALRLTEPSHGNAIGIGMADVVPVALAAAVDRAATEANANTSGWTTGARIPPTVPTEAAAIARACAGDPAALRCVIAQDTAHLDRFLVTPALLPEVDAHPRLAVDGPPALLTFDDAGNLTTPLA